MWLHLLVAVELQVGDFVRNRAIKIRIGDDGVISIRNQVGVTVPLDFSGHQS